MPRQSDVVRRLIEAGFTLDDAQALRRIANTLRRWYEMECGSDKGAIERDAVTGKPFMVGHYADGTAFRTVVYDREASAKKRLAVIMARYPSLAAYHQTDPRGASLYIIRPGDIPDGAPVDSYYSNGIAVY